MLKSDASVYSPENDRFLMFSISPVKSANLVQTQKIHLYKYINA